MVEYIGMQNLINAVKSKTGLRDGKRLFGFKGTSSLFPIFCTKICLAKLTRTNQAQSEFLSG